MAAKEQCRLAGVEQVLLEETGDDGFWVVRSIAKRVQSVEKWCCCIPRMNVVACNDPPPVLPLVQMVMRVLVNVSSETVIEALVVTSVGLTSVYSYSILVQMWST